MRDGERLHDPDSVHGHIGRICFKTGPPTTIGAELEWLLANLSEPTKPVPLDRLRTTLDQVGALPGGSKITYEPGGQLELSSRPASGLVECISALKADVLTVTSGLDRLGLSTLPTAIDPYRKPFRQLKHPRYDAMEAFYDNRGTDGRVMMCATAAVQVNLDAGADPDDITRRWHLLNALGPVLVAAFANSPTHAGAPTGWKSGRQAVWQQIQPALGTEQFNGEYPAKRWTEYVLDAPVMVIRRDGQDWLTDPGFTFRQWLDGALGKRAGPTLDDLAYHLTTLFPPVRPRGFFEVRYIDMQAPDWWPVPVAVLTALTANAEASEQALAAVTPVVGEWETASRCALADPALQQAAARCFDITLDVLPSVCPRTGTEAGTGAELVDLVSAYYETYVRRGRCPADDVLEKQTRMETPHEPVAQPH